MIHEPTETGHESAVDALLVEYFERVDRGEPFDRGEFARLHPDAASELMELLQVSEFVADAVRDCDVCSHLDVDRKHAGDDVCESVSMNLDPTAIGQLHDGCSEPTAHYLNEPPAESHTSGKDKSPATIGDYQLLEELGRGGMGVVYKAQQVSLNRIVAVKMLLAGKMASELELQRFYSEARSAARLRHPNIVSIYDVRETDGHHYFSMDFIEGRTLDKVASDESLSEQRIALLVKLIAEAVEYAHQNGILHRDLKPANVLVHATGMPHVLDFGLAKHLEDDSGLTSSGTVLGTPSYMSPEQAAGQTSEIVPASDVYSLGAILYFLLTGGPPFRGRTAAETVSMVVKDEPPAVRSVNPKASRALATICEKCLRKDPAERYQSAQELAVDLERFLRGDPIEARPIGAIRRGWFWCRDIPLVAALVGRTPSTSNRRQVRLQWTALIVLLLSGLVYAGLLIHAARLPDEIVVASGHKGGMYHDFSRKLADSLQQSTGRDVRVVETAGSIENADRLTERTSHLGLLQYTAVDIDRVEVVAPLYREFAHVIVRKEDTHLKSISDLKKHTISLGPEGSGNRAAAKEILSYFGITGEHETFSSDDFSRLDVNDSLHAAIVISGLDNAALKKLLNSRRFRLLPIPPVPELFLGSGFHPDTLKASDYPGSHAIDKWIATVSTPALLVVRKGERPSIVKAACQALDNEQLFENQPGRYSPEHFSHLTKTLPMHPTAANYFKSRRQILRTHDD
jgi:hypothetical protein